MRHIFARLLSDTVMSVSTGRSICLMFEEMQHLELEIIGTVVSSGSLS